jgi:hypothetical protein
MPFYTPANNRQREVKENVDLAARALGQAWPIDSDKRTEIVDMLMDIVRDPLVYSEVKVKAMKTLVAATAVNLKAVDMAMNFELKSRQARADSSEPVPVVIDDDELAEGLEGLLECRKPKVVEPERPTMDDFIGESA